MRANLICTIIFICIVTSLDVHGQDFQLTQFYASPLYLNPGFTGSAEASRVVLHGRSQWTNLPRPYKANVLAFDHNFQRYNSGLGIMATSERSGTTGLTMKSIGLLYAYRIDLSSKWVARPGLQFSGFSRRIDPDGLIFGDQVIDGGLLASQEDLDRYNHRLFFDVSSGVVFHDDRVWIGLSAHHLNRPNLSFFNDRNELPIKWSMHGGIRLDLDPAITRKLRERERTHAITPAFQYKQQGNFHQLDLGLYWQYDPVVIGGWYRGIPLRGERYHGNFSDAIAVLLGISWKGFAFGYSYDMTISQLGPTNSAGSHEISLGYVFGKQRSPKRKVQKSIPCPTF